MSALTHDQVRHIAKLARITLREEQVERFASELTSILDYVEQLQEVDTKDVKPLKHVTGLSNALRKDERVHEEIDPDALLDASPLPVVEHQIQTDSAHG